jgi:hypothetical protein
MTEDLAQLAAQLAAYLGPFTPYLVRAGERAAEEAGGRVGGDAWAGVKRVWGRLRPAIDADQRASEAVVELSGAPDDADLRAQLRVQLGRLLAQDDELASGLARLLVDTPASVTGVVVNGEISGGTVNGIVNIGGARRLG